MQETVSTQPLTASRPAGILWLALAGVISIALWQIPYGHYVIYPFTILATWFHEMGHGITAMLLGGHFDKLELFSDGSGVATHSGGVFLGPIGRALVAAGGLMGPPIAGALLIMAGRRAKIARISLWILGAMLAVSVLIWVRTLFGVVMVTTFAGVIFAVSRFGSLNFQRFAVQFLGVQACISTYKQLDYLFMKQADIGGQIMLSDTGAIADNLLLPYWIWGGLIAGVSFALLVMALGRAFRSE